jgi:predicted transcriptional regulator
MIKDSATGKVYPRLVAEIVRGYLSKNAVAVDQLAGLISTVHRTLTGLDTNTAAQPPETEKLTPAVSIRRSVQPDHVVCLECGFRGKTLSRHLRIAHGLEPAGYRARWRLPLDHTLTAPNYSAQRSAMATQFGLGQRRRRWPATAG